MGRSMIRLADRSLRTGVRLASCIVKNAVLQIHAIEDSPKMDEESNWRSDSRRVPGTRM